MALFLGLDFSYVLPAVLFTLLAVILGSSFFKKPKPSKKKEDDAARVERTEKVEHFQPKVELPEVAPIVEHKEEKVEQKEAESVAVAPVVEEMGVVEEQPETTEIQVKGARSPKVLHRIFSLFCVACCTERVFCCHVFKIDFKMFENISLFGPIGLKMDESAEDLRKRDYTRLCLIRCVTDLI